MDEYQQYVFSLFSNYRLEPNYPTYPPYHVGLYLEDYFIRDFLNENKSYDRIFIPISWTTIYCENKSSGLQEVLSQLDRQRQYFVVCQHDDAPMHQLPPDTLIFSASDTVYKPDRIPIPVVCSPVQKITNNKTIFASFVGSYTHSIRSKLQSVCTNKDGYYFACNRWIPKIEDGRFEEFLTITSKSKFTLCPRGYGNTSFRLYECMQLGSVPVYISDHFHLPWSDEINWDDFCVLVDEDEIQNLDYILKSISDKKYNKMLEKIEQLYSQYFTLDSLHTNIIKRIV